MQQRVADLQPALEMTDGLYDVHIEVTRRERERI